MRPGQFDRLDSETHVLVTDPDGEIVSVSGPIEVFALLALAKDALPDGDPRKISRHWVLDLRADHPEIATVLPALLPPTE